MSSDMINVNEMVEANKGCCDNWEIVDKDSVVNGCFGCDGFFKLTKKDIMALRKGKVLYHDGLEYCHFMIMED